MSQKIIIDLDGFTLSEIEITLLTHPNTAGILLFTKNFQSRSQLCALTNTIHQINPEVIIFIDHEGGYVQRILRHGFLPLMSAGAIGRVYDRNAQAGLETARFEGKTMASQLIACGVDVSFAPVLDLYDQNSTIIGGLDRAFHANPDLVSSIASEYIQGMHEQGMPCVCKHFPGHGTCEKDSHRTVPIQTKSFQTLETQDLKPFQQLIQQGILDALMPAHVLYPEIDMEHVTTYSKIWLKTILRDQFHFEGLIISDCLGMTGADIGDLSTRAMTALNAGCDLLIVANQTRRALLDLVEQLPITPCNPAFETFKQKLNRFQSINHQQKLNQSIHQQSTDEYKDEINLNNPTTTI